MSIFRTRRSLKPAAMDPARAVPRDVLVEILEDAQWAPTHGLTQPWRFQIFTGDARPRLADGLQDIYNRTIPAEARNEDKYAKLASAPRSAPVIVAVGVHVVTNGKIPEVEEIAAASCAVQNLMLSAELKGISSFWSTPPVTMSREFATWLGLDSATHRMLGLVYLGYAREGQSLPKSTRDPLSENVVFHEV